MSDRQDLEALKRIRTHFAKAGGVALNDDVCTLCEILTLDFPLLEPKP